MQVGKGLGWAWGIIASLALLASAQFAAAEQQQDESRREAPRGRQRGPEFGPGRGPGGSGPGNFGGFGGFGGGGFGGGPRFERQPDRLPELPIETGYLFLDGQYLAPPYKIALAEGGVTVNGRQLPCRAPEQEFARGGGGDRRFENPDPWRRLAVQVGIQLSNQAVVMAFTDQPLVVLDSSGGAYDLFQRLTGEGKNASQTELVDRLPTGFDERVWNQWVGSFTPSLGLRARAVSLITNYDTTDAEAHAAVAATRRLNSLAYPLTLGGMLLTVLSVGHLLGGRPSAGKSAYDQDASPETLRALRYSLILVGLLSLNDLAWTIMASQAGQMRELNPFGSQFIESPTLLSLFKISATGLAIGLLFALRKFRRAQAAAWWACLLLTILAFRWLTFNSMMISA